MTMEKIEQLARIYNTLLLVNTKGEDTMLMADCLNALRTFVTTEQQMLAAAAQTVVQASSAIEEE